MIQEGQPRELMSLDEGRLVVCRHYLPQFQSLGWTTTAAIMQDQRLHVVRRLAERDNCIVPMSPPGQSGPVTLYLKRHWVPPGLTWAGHDWFLGKHPFPGLAEAHALQACRNAGVPTLRLVATGAILAPHDGSPRPVAQSFFLSEEVGGQDARSYFLEFGQTDEPGQQARQKEKQAVLRAVAETAQRFHLAGLSHQDFYLDHFFLQKIEPHRYSAHLIDLQRVQQSTNWLQRARRRLKDLAQMRASLQRARLAPADLDYWFRCYFGTGQQQQRLGLADQFWCQAIKLRQLRRRVCNEWLRGRSGAHLR